MKLIITSLFILVSSFSFAAKEGDLVDVSKDSKLSTYFKKINKKVSDNSEEKSLGIEKVETKDESEVDLLGEEEILLKEATTKSQSASQMSPMKRMIMAVVGLLFIAGLFMMGVQKIGKKKGYPSMAQSIQIMTQKSIGPKKNLMLIRVAGETILLGVTDHNINHIKTLSLLEDELPQFTEPKFSKHLKEKIEQAQEEPSVVEKEPEEVDGFSISRLDDVKQAASKWVL